MVNCKKCGKEITDQNDFNMLAFLGVKPVSFCNACYSARERGVTRHLFYIPKGFPINASHSQ